MYRYSMSDANQAAAVAKQGAARAVSALEREKRKAMALERALEEELERVRMANVNRNQAERTARLREEELEDARWGCTS